MPASDLADLTDAVVRGRLTLAELATLNGEELEAIYAIALTRLDTRRDSDAVVLLSALVTLFPFRARFWRAYGVALQRCGSSSHALAAYDAALLLDPEHGLTLCHRAEVCVLLGDEDMGIQAIRQLMRHPDNAAAARATLLWQVMATRRSPAPRAHLATDNTVTDVSALAEHDAFTLTDGRSLPLEPSRYPDVEDSAEDAPDAPDDLAESTQRVFHTQTKIPTPLPDDAPGAAEVTQGTVVTAVQRRQHGWALADDEITLTAGGPTPPEGD